LAVADLALEVVSAVADRKVGNWPAVFFCVELGLAGLCRAGLA
jgi:hypothetical protein